MTSNRSRKQFARDFRSQMRSSNTENDNAAHPGSISDRVSKLRVQLDEIKANCKITDKKKTTFKAKYVEDETVAALDEDEVEVEVPLPIDTEDEDLFWGRFIMQLFTYQISILGTGTGSIAPFLHTLIYVFHQQEN